MSEDVVKPIKLNPSAMPYLAQCKCWERQPSPPTPQMRRGTALDALVREWGTHPKMDFGAAWGLFKDLSGEDIEAAQWAKDAILQTAGDSPVTFQKAACKFKMPLPIPNLVVSGEMDAFCDGHVFDLKSGKKRDYEAQMLPYAAYTLSQNENIDEVKTHLVFCDLKEIETHTFTRNDTRTKLIKFALDWTNRFKVPTPGDCCAFCRYRRARGCVYVVGQ